jgi:1,4-alpha-glucan branching enzyme
MWPPARAKLLDDAWLRPFEPHLLRRAGKHEEAMARLAKNGSLLSFADAHFYYGLHRTETGWVFREWAPHATSVNLIGDHSGWQELPEFSCTRLNPKGDWELHLPPDALHHNAHYRLKIRWDGGEGDRIPAYARRVVQDHSTLIFSAQVWQPEEYVWRHQSPKVASRPPIIYEAHVGMGQERAGVGTYIEFREKVLPRIVDAGYNTLQLMAVQEHPYYGSFGYHVSNFFAPSSRCGTPEEFKELVDAAHGAGLTVIMDLVHSHSVKNENEGLSRFDGTSWQYFHDGARGSHEAWDSRCFDYSKDEVLRFLLSNCRYWIEEFRMDGFRFDGVTSMLYSHHGLGKVFTTYDDYFNPEVDEDALTYLALANTVIHEVHADALTIAEDVSGMPGLGAPAAEGGAGFDARLAMGVPDIWFKLAADTPDEDWHVEHLWHELTNRRADERVISYVESHDQSIVGGKTFLFELLDAAIYTEMEISRTSPQVDRGIALWKIARLLTLGTANYGYLNFIGNEFGHPEWVDFPREGNGWSYHYARRQWSLRDNPLLKYHALGDFDRELVRMLGNEGFFGGIPTLILSHVTDHVLIFERGEVIIAVNLHPSQSFADRPLNAAPGSYSLVLDTDEARFAGLSRLAAGQRYLSHDINESGVGHGLRLYLPSRCALVLRREQA